MENACLNDQQKSAIAERLAIAEHCLLEGADEYLQVSLSEILNLMTCVCDSGDGSGHVHDENTCHGLRYFGGGGKQRFIDDTKKLQLVPFFVCRYCTRRDFVNCL